MATYPIKMMIDESGQPFVPLTSLDAVIGEKNLQYILDAEELSAGHFKVNFKDLEMKDITNSIIVVRWPQITSTVKPSYLQLNDNTEAILYDGTGKEYMDLEDASGTINLLAYDGTKWIQATGSGSGGGHVITDGEGHSMEQQKVLSFVGFNVENDAANRATKIVNPTPINNLTTTESGQGGLEAYQGNILSKRSVPTGGTKGQVLAKSGNGDHQLEWINQDSDDVVTSDGSIEEIIGLTYEEYKALEAAGQLNPTTQCHILDMAEKNTTQLTEEQIQEMIDETVKANPAIKESTVWHDNHYYTTFYNDLVLVYGYQDVTMTTAASPAAGMYYADDIIIELPCYFNDLNYVPMATMRADGALVWIYATQVVDTDHISVSIASPSMRENLTVRIHYHCMGTRRKN